MSREAGGLVGAYVAMRRAGMLAMPMPWRLTYSLRHHPCIEREASRKPAGRAARSGSGPPQEQSFLGRAQPLHALPPRGRARAPGPP